MAIMKTTMTFLLTLILSVNVSGQNNPGCNDLTIENIIMDDDTANFMKITISNSCPNCLSGLSGPVYMELRVIRIVLPFDTIAASNCWCLQSPNNSSQRIYSIYSTISSLPPISDIRVSLIGGCDTIPFSTTLGIANNVIESDCFIFPNPSNSELNIQINSTKQFQFSLYNSFGEKIIDKTLNSKSSTLNLSAYSSGIYFYKMISDESIIKTGKIIKQ